MWPLRTGTNYAIDYASRTVTLKTDSGKSVTLQVGPQAKNFNQVKVGDKVKVDTATGSYVERVKG